MSGNKKKYVSPFAERIYVLKEDILTLSDGIGRATFDVGAQVGFDDFT